MAYAPRFKFYLSSSTVETIGEMGTVVVRNLDLPICSGLALKGTESRMAINTKKHFSISKTRHITFFFYSEDISIYNMAHGLFLRV